MRAALSWWLAPVSGAAVHQVDFWISWHGRLMVLAWAVLLPLGVLAARFLKVMPGQNWPSELDNRTWWHLHRTLQYSGVVAMTVGLLLVWCAPATLAAPAAQVMAAAPVTPAALHAGHRWGGWAVLTLGWLQVASGLLRGSKGDPADRAHRGDHYHMTRRRRLFERIHKSLGYLALLWAMVAILMGLALADAPRWMFLVLIGWWLLWAATFAHGQRRGRCIDTYQAIWGPDPQHPGNRIPPTGWGIRRGAAPHPGELP